MPMARVWQNRAGQIELKPAPPASDAAATVAAPGADAAATIAAPEADSPLELDDAEYQRATEFSDLGRDQAQAGYLTSALLYFNQARAVGLADPNLLLRMVWTLLKAGAAERCVNLARDALKLYPDHYEVKNTLGLALREMGDFDGAEQVYIELLDAWPRFKSAHINIALLLFRRRAYLQAAEHFEWRLAPAGEGIFDPPARWDEARIAGRSVLLRHEQGLGDTINFLRLADSVAELGANVTALVQKPLLDLLRPAFPNVTLATHARASQFDFQAPLLCVLHRLGLTPDTIPNQQLALIADPTRVRRWRQRLQHYECLRVGVVRTGQPRHGRNTERSLPPAAVAQWNQIPGIQVFDLEMRAPDRPGLRSWDAAGIVNLGSGLDHGQPPFSDTMALVSELDVVVSCDTSIAHLVGAMERPVWLALDAISDWRWHRDGADSDWYPTMRIYRQATRGHWQPVVDAIARDLLTLAEQQAHSPR